MKRIKNNDSFLKTLDKKDVFEKESLESYFCKDVIENNVFAKDPFEDEEYVVEENVFISMFHKSCLYKHILQE